MPTAPHNIWCLHGAVGAAADWYPFRQEWESDGHALRVVDLWRFLDCCPRSLPATAQALNAEAQATAGKNLLVGYSMGGRIALHALLQKNSPWDAAVIISAHPGLETEEEKMARRKIDTDWSVKCLHGEWESFLAEWQAQGILRDAGSLSERAPLRMRRKEIARSFLDWSLGAQENLWPHLSEIAIPVLWLTGENDQKFTAIAQRAMADMPNARHQVVPQASHRLPWQLPQDFSQSVLHFIESL